MKARLTTEKQNAKGDYTKKEVVSYREVVVSTRSGIETPVVCKCYMGRSSSASVVYANLWIRGKNFYTSGSGSAGGYGYHKESAAVQGAITSAGVTLHGSPYGGERDNNKTQTYIDGVGDSAIDQALLAITRALGFRGKAKVVSL